MEDSVSTRKAMTYRKHSSNKEKPSNTVFDKHKLKAGSNVLSTIKEETASSVTYETVIDLLSVGSDNIFDVNTVQENNKVVSKKKATNKATSTDFIYNQTRDICDLKLQTATKKDTVNLDTDKKTMHVEVSSPGEGAVTTTVAYECATKHDQIKENTKEYVFNERAINDDSDTFLQHVEESNKPVTDTLYVDHAIVSTDKATVSNSVNDRNEGFIKHHSQRKDNSLRVLSSHFRMLENSETLKPSKDKFRRTKDMAFNTNKVVDEQPSQQHCKHECKHFNSNLARSDNSTSRTYTGNSKKISSPLLPMRKDSMRALSGSCSFQHHEKEHRCNPKQINNTYGRSALYQTFPNHDSDNRGSPKQAINETKHLTFPEVVEAVLQKPPKIHYSDFYKNARKAVAWRKRLEQPWMKGSEMQAFYKM